MVLVFYVRGRFYVGSVDKISSNQRRTMSEWGRIATAVMTLRAIEKSSSFEEKESELECIEEMEDRNDDSAKEYTREYLEGVEQDHQIDKLRGK